MHTRPQRTVTRSRLRIVGNRIEIFFVKFILIGECKVHKCWPRVWTLFDQYANE